MATNDFDLAIIGAGSGGLTAAGFAGRLGARVALVEKNRIGRLWAETSGGKCIFLMAFREHDGRQLKAQIDAALI